MLRLIIVELALVKLAYDFQSALLGNQMVEKLREIVGEVVVSTNLRRSSAPNKFSEFLTSLLVKI